MAKDAKRVRKRKRKPKTGRRIVMARPGHPFKINGPSVIDVYIARSLAGRRIWLEVVPIDPNGPQDDLKPS